MPVEEALSATCAAVEERSGATEGARIAPANSDRPRDVRSHHAVCPRICFGAMKRKHEGKDLQSFVELGRGPRSSTLDQVNGLLPKDVSSPTDLRSALESFQEMDIKAFDDVQADGAGGELEAQVKQEPDDGAAAAPTSSSDPVSLYLKEMANFQLLSREQEVEIAKRIEAGENEVEEEVLRSPVTLDVVIEMGARVEAGEADLRDIFEEDEGPADNNDERG